MKYAIKGRIAGVDDKQIQTLSSQYNNKWRSTITINHDRNQVEFCLGLLTRAELDDAMTRAESYVDQYIVAHECSDDGFCEMIYKYPETVV